MSGQPSDRTGGHAGGRTSTVIHDIGYRHYDGPRLATREIERALFTETVRAAFGWGRSARSKIMPLLLLAATLLPALIMCIVMSVVPLVDEVPGGEVSPFLVHELQPGDQVEIHGPLGSYFVWGPGESERPVQLVAGGSGVVPLYAMAELHDRAQDATAFRLLYSVRTPEDRFFASELDAIAARGRLETHYVYTRAVPAGWSTTPGRITRDALAAATWPAEHRPRVYVCGPTAFVETVADWLTDLGHDPQAIRTERFGGG